VRRQVVALLLLSVLSLAGRLHAQRVAPGLVLRQLTKDGKSLTERGAGFAPTTDQILLYKLISKTDRQLWLMRGDGSQGQPISPVGWPTLATWSPNGSKIAYVFANKNDGNSDAAVCVHDVATRETKKTTGYRRGDFGSGDDAPPIWSPGSDHFAYQITDRRRDATFLTVFPVDGSAPVRIGENLAGTKVFETTGSWSPDGTKVVFVGLSSKEGEPEIYLANADGTGLKQLTNDRRDCGEPKFSPDGQWIVFFSAKDRYPDEVRDGWNWDMLIMRPDGSDEQTIVSGRSQSSDGRGTFVHPSWSPDGSYIICHGSLRDASNRGYHGTFFIDWRRKKWRRILGTTMGSKEHSDQHDWAISPDSAKVFRHGATYVVRGAGDEQATDFGDDFDVYDVPTDTVSRLLDYRKRKDALYLYSDGESWAPDSKRILICQGKAISWEKKEFEPDLYVLEAPSAVAAQYSPAPPSAAPVPEAPSAQGPSTEAEAAPQAPPAQPEVGPAPQSQGAPAWSLIRPENMTVQQALDALPAGDKTYILTSPERNLLIVNGPPDVAHRVREYLKAVDTPVPQVTMDVLVTEMSKTASRTLGLDWAYAKAHVGAKLPIGESGPGQIFYHGVQRLDEQFFVALNALAEQGEVTIRANPRLVAISGKTATMNIRRTKYYFYTQGYDQFGRPIIQQSDISADIGGKITPRVLGDGNIVVEVEVTVGSFAFTATSSLPDVTSRQTTTSVVLKDGETIMIGGLILKQETRATSKTPVLGDIPLIGQLFRSSHRRLEENVLTILITPRLGLQRASLED